VVAAQNSVTRSTINLTTGKSGLILDISIENGNPADSEKLLPMLGRHRDHYGSTPRQMAADGGYASQRNLTEAKALGVEDMAFHKKCGLKVEEITRTKRVYRKLRNFGAGIAANISRLKRAWGTVQSARPATFPSVHMVYGRRLLHII